MIVAHNTTSVSRNPSSVATSAAQTAVNTVNRVSGTSSNINTHRSTSSSKSNSTTVSKTPSSVASSVANTTLNAANKVSKNISTNKIGTTDVVLNSVNNVNNHITKVRVRRFGGLSRVRVDSVNSNQLQNLKTVNTVLETVKIIKNNIGNSNISKDKLDFIKSQDIMDPISRKIVSRELTSSWNESN